jgi:hypothetical protein
MDDRYRARLIRKVHRLALRGYSVDQIALMSRLIGLEVRAILNGASQPDPAVKPAKPPKPAAKPKPVKPAKPPKPIKWKRTGAHLDSAGWTPPTPPVPAIAAAELVEALDLAVVPEPIPVDDGPAWTEPRSLRGEANGQSKLTRADVDEARELRAAGWSTGALAKRFGVQRSTMCYALNGTTWKD